MMIGARCIRSKVRLSRLHIPAESVEAQTGYVSESLREHPVPVREEAISAIGTRSLPIDIYIWLAYRLHVLTKPTPIS
jgi:hypothetical protein